MHGRVFNITHSGQQNQLVEVMISFGGLLFKLNGEQSHLSLLEGDMRYVEMCHRNLTLLILC